MVDHIQRAVIPPVDVFQEDHRRRLSTYTLEVLSQVHQRPVAQLLGIIKNPLQVVAFTDVKTQQLRDDVSAHLSFFIYAQHFAKPTL